MAAIFPHFPSCRPTSSGWSLPALFILIIFAALPLQSQARFVENGGGLNRGTDAGFLLDTPTRKKIDLAGPWTYAIEGGDSGTVRIPSAYEFPAKVSFTRKMEFTAEELDTVRYHLVFYGVNYQADLIVNGEYVLGHPGGGTSLVQEIPENLLQVGPENTVQVVTSNILDPRKTFPLRQRVRGSRAWGGIIRDAFLLGTPLLYVKDAVATSVLQGESGEAQLSVRAIIDGPDPLRGEVKGIRAGQVGFVVEVFEKVSGLSVARSAVVPVPRLADSWGDVRAEVTIPGARLWSPETPELYLVKCSLVTEADKQTTLVDEYDVLHGVRTLAVENGDLRLNGRRIFLKGVVWNEDHPDTGPALTVEQMERDIIAVKGLGANVIRFANSPPHPYMLNLCDRYGLMAMVEIPLSGPADVLAEEQYQEAATTLVREMVLRDRNHVSVCGWGLGNEFDATVESSHALIEGLVRQVKLLDPRPTYYGAAPSGKDRCIDLVDLAAVSIEARDAKEFKAALESWKSRHPGKPVIVARFGTEVQQENRAGYTDPLSQQAQARFYIQRFDAIRSQDYDGAIVWAFNDWLGDRPALTVHSGDPWLHSMGLVSRAREKRMAYDAVRSVFQGEKFSALPPGSYSPGAPIVYVLSGFVLLVGLAYLYNANRRFRDHLNRSLLNSYNFFADVRDQRSVPVFHSALLGIIVSFATAVVWSSYFLHFRDSRVLDDALSLLLVTDGLKVALVRLVWSPLEFILAVGGATSLGMLLVSVAITGVRIVLKTRVYLYHAFTLTVWAASPLIILIPVGMILYRIMESPVYVLPSLVLVVALVFWVALRFLKGFSIVFDVRRARVWLAAAALVLAGGAGLYLYYDLVHSAPAYFSFITQGGAIR